MNDDPSVGASTEWMKGFLYGVFVMIAVLFLILPDVPLKTLWKLTHLEKYVDCEKSQMRLGEVFCTFDLRELNHIEGISCLPNKEMPLLCRIRVDDKFAKFGLMRDLF